MKVMILAAGRGERMGALTEFRPKPLLRVAGKSLIEHHIMALKEAGFSQFVINIAYRGQQIINALGTGEKWGVDIVYSNEGDEALETGGGIHKALPLLGDTHFLLVNADVWTNYPFANLQDKTSKLMHLVLVPNPEHHLQGDFVLSKGDVIEQGEKMLTYGGIGVYHPELFHRHSPGKFPLAPIIREAIQCQQVTGELYDKAWVDVGTPERLTDVEARLKR
ncbi:MAG: mannose-1-phosphate guanylyltransferase [Piscirickettsiaceae bacterium]|nr:MAG: mannose-1-phosphate guanylyltransferase [Piscirickettsiaceae bacterium]